MTEQWQELKETVTEMRDNDGTGTQQEVCKFLANLMDILEKQMQEPKIGHWEYGYAFTDGNYCKCSECKEIIKCIYPMHYCPNCGAKMVEPQESEEV